MPQPLPLPHPLRLTHPPTSILTQQSIPTHQPIIAQPNPIAQNPIPTHLPLPNRSSLSLATFQLAHPAPHLPRNAIGHEHKQRDNHDGHSDDPKEGVRVVLHAIEAFEILTKVSDEESQGKEEDGYGGEYLHAFVLVGAHDVEDEVDEVVGCATLQDQVSKPGLRMIDKKKLTI